MKSKKYLKVLTLLGVFVLVGCGNNGTSSSEPSSNVTSSQSSSSEQPASSSSSSEQPASSSSEDTHTHNWSYSETNAPTQDAEGSGSYTCDGCDEVKTVKVMKVPTISVSGRTVTWTEVPGATSYAVSVNGVEQDLGSAKTYTVDRNITASEVKVYAKSTSEEYYEKGGAYTLSTVKGTDNLIAGCNPTFDALEKPTYTLQKNVDGWDGIYLNNSDTATSIIKDGDNVYGKMQKINWFTSAEIIMDLTPAIITTGNQYTFAIDLMASASANTANNGAETPVYSHVDIKMAHFDSSDVYQQQFVGSVPMNEVSTTEWTTKEFTFTAEDFKANNWNQLVIQYIVEGSLDNNYFLFDNYKVYAAGDQSKTDLNVLRHQKYDVNTNTFDTTYTTVKSLGVINRDIYGNCFGDGSGCWDRSWGNYDMTPIDIINDNGNAYAKMYNSQWWPVNSCLAKAMPDDLGKKAGDYQLELDVNFSQVAHDADNGSGATSHIITQIVTGGATFSFDLPKISAGDYTANTWEHITMKFSIAGDTIGTFMQVKFWFWPEGSITNNYVLIDNVNLFSVNDQGESTGVNVDTNGNGDFSQFLGEDSVVFGQWKNGFMFEPSCSEGSGFYYDNGNRCAKLYTTGNDCAFNIAIGFSLQTNKVYEASMKVKLGEDATHMGNLGFTLFHAAGHMDDPQFMDMPRVNSASEDHITPADGWVTITATITTYTAPVDWCNMYIYAFTNNTGDNFSVNNYVLIDDVCINEVTVR